MNEEAQDKDNEPVAPSVAPPAATRVTMEMVRDTIGDSDPNGWSAQKLLDALGSGSKRTHQKFLDILRMERSQAAMPALGEPDQVPPTPRELSDALWRQAWSMATGKSATYLAFVTAQRDGLRLRLETAEADIESHLDSSETADEGRKQALLEAAASAQQAEAEKERADAAKAALEALQTDMVAQQARSEAALEALRSSSDAKCKAFELELAHVRQHGEEQLQLAQKQAELMLRGLQEAVDRQAQREVDVRQQLAEANKRADDNAKRVIELTDKIGTLVSASKS